MNQKNKKRLTGFYAVMVLFLSMPLAYGQGSTTWARLFGTVTDQSGDIIPGVEVTAVEKSTNVSRTALSDEAGNYVLDKLSIGVYDISTELTGFKKQLAADVRLTAGQKARVDFVLTPGEIAEVVTVTGASTTIDTATAEMSAVISVRLKSE